MQRGGYLLNTAMQSGGPAAQNMKFYTEFLSPPLTFSTTFDIVILPVFHCAALTGRTGAALPRTELSDHPAARCEKQVLFCQKGACPSGNDSGGKGTIYGKKRGRSYG